MSLSASEHLLKRFHGQPRVPVTHLNILFYRQLARAALCSSWCTRCI